jgi:NHL repeat
MITCGLNTGRRYYSPTRYDRSGMRRRRFSNSTLMAHCCRDGAAPGPGPKLEHGIYVDEMDHVRLGAGGDKDAHILEFTRGGKFLMQIGHQGQSRGSNDTENLGAAANLVVDAPENELYVADGYANHRIIVFDATTGAYKRHWGAFGGRPDDVSPRQAKTCRSHSAALSSTRTSRACTIWPALRRRNSVSSTPCGFQTTAWSMFATAPMIACCANAPSRPYNRDSSGRVLRDHRQMTGAGEQQ